MIGARSLEAEPHRRDAAGTSTLIDPMPRLFAEFRALLDRHAAALAACDRVEAQLLAHVGFPRVRLPCGADGVRRHAADAATIARAVLAAADSLLAAPGWTCHAVELKLLVLLAVHAPGPVADEVTPWRELRLILADLDSLADSRRDVPWSPA